MTEKKKELTWNELERLEAIEEEKNRIKYLVEKRKRKIQHLIPYIYNYYNIDFALLSEKEYLNIYWNADAKRMDRRREIESLKKEIDKLNKENKKLKKDLDFEKKIKDGTIKKIVWTVDSYSNITRFNKKIDELGVEAVGTWKLARPLTEIPPNIDIETFVKFQTACYYSEFNECDFTRAQTIIKNIVKKWDNRLKKSDVYSSQLD